MSLKMSTEKPTIIFLSNKAFSNNPMLKMYTNAFTSEGKCVVSCTDSHLETPNQHLDLIKSPLIANAWNYVRAAYGKIHRRFPFLNKNSFAIKISYYLLIISFFAHFILTNALHFLKLIIHTKKNVAAVFAVDGDYLFAAWLASKYYKAKLYYFVYEVWPDQVPASTAVDYAERCVRTIIERAISHRADKVITSHRKISKYTRRKYSLDSTQLLDIPVCPEKIELDSPSTNTPLKFHYHGAYFAARGLDQLVLAFKEVENAHLYLRGIGAYQTELKELVRSEGLEEKVFFLPPLPVDQLVIGAVPYDVGVILAAPNTANGRFCIGFKFFEYINSGLAVLAPSSFPLKDLIELHKCGKNYGWPERSAFVRSINDLVSSRDSVTTMKFSAQSLRSIYNSAEQKKQILQLVLPR